jgi:Lipocalin-like domain
VQYILDKNALLGTWRLKSYVVTGAAGERSTPYGENPTGYLSYSADDRMQVIGVATERSTPAGGAPAVNDRAVLYDTMFAYAGSFSVEGDEIIHHVDISWNGAWTGTDQVRACEVRGNTLTLTTRIRDPVSGEESHYAVTWEKMPSMS